MSLMMIVIYNLFITAVHKSGIIDFCFLIAVSKKPPPTPAPSSSGSSTKEDKMRQLESLLSTNF